MDFDRAWKLVSTYPAKAAGIGNSKGSIAPGWDADFILVKPNENYISAIASVYIGGREVAKYQPNL
ncbi:MAG: amidohydrolase family protein [Pleurocapsa sp.]